MAYETVGVQVASTKFKEKSWLEYEFVYMSIDYYFVLFPSIFAADVYDTAQANPKPYTRYVMMYFVLFPIIVAFYSLGGCGI